MALSPGQGKLFKSSPVFLLVSFDGNYGQTKVQTRNPTR